ncbi:unnamed protein product [Arctogadus glacialis]
MAQRTGSVRIGWAAPPYCSSVHTLVLIGCSSVHTLVLIGCSSVHTLVLIGCSSVHTHMDRFVPHIVQLKLVLPVLPPVGRATQMRSTDAAWLPVRAQPHSAGMGACSLTEWV